MAIDTGVANFENQRLLLRCARNEYLDGGDARRLCSKLNKLLTNQGAAVEVELASNA
ncbi:MAG: hypothetical protein HY901_30165, partial [Deltaproteobacteria bacterium]|nr:hypothetical protein [Deltaproteobacteria bacterium]